MMDYLTDSNGNSGQERGDSFLDYDDDLEINVNGWGKYEHSQCYIMNRKLWQNITMILICEPTIAAVK